MANFLACIRQYKPVCQNAQHFQTGYTLSKDMGMTLCVITKGKSGSSDCKYALWEIILLKNDTIKIYS